MAATQLGTSQTQHRAVLDGVDVFGSYTAPIAGRQTHSERGAYSPITVTGVFELVFVPLPSCP